MKRLSEAQRARNLLRANFEERRSRRRQERKLQRAAQTGVYETIVLEVPEHFNLSGQRDEALKLFERLRRVILTERKRGLIDFSMCRSISAGAGLILAAEADRCRNLRLRDGRPALTGTYPRGEELARFLDSLGFFKLLKIRSPRYALNDTSATRFITIRSGRRDRGQAMHEVAEVTDSQSVQFDEKARTILYEALLEAMNNVTVHAYPPKRSQRSLPVLHGQWWAAGHWDITRREIGVLIYDQGIGIPKTLPDSKHMGLIRKIRSQFGLGDSDPECIQAAMELGHSRFEQPHRGRGMAALRRAVNIVEDGNLLILSGRGGYIMKANGGEDVFPLPESIGGTFIEWRIRDEKLIRWDNVEGRDD